MLIPDPFSLKIVYNFNSSPSFGFFDILKHLINHSTDYDKHGLAADKSFDDYRLFNDGYVESLLTYCSIETRGRPCLRCQSEAFHEVKDGRKKKDHYDPWFILDGKGANRGSVLEARFKCKGGRDGESKHIVATMYALEDLSNTRGEDSVTSRPCVWVRRPERMRKRVQ